MKQTLALSILILFVSSFFPINCYSLVGLPPEVSKEMADEDVRDLFPNADYPFVQKANHCGANNWTHIVPERPLCFKGQGKCLDDFTEACDFHDRCYMWRGMTQEDCDEGFKKRMFVQCESGGTAKEQKTCHRLAQVYYQAVHWFGKSSFWRIQNRQDLYEAWLKTWLDLEKMPKDLKTLPN